MLGAVSAFSLLKHNLGLELGGSLYDGVSRCLGVSDQVGCENGFEYLSYLEGKGLFNGSDPSILRQLLIIVDRDDLLDQLNSTWSSSSHNGEINAQKAKVYSKIPKLARNHIKRSRESDLAALIDMDIEYAESTRYYIIMGNPGTGKKQLAIKYCNDMIERCGVVYFVRCDSYTNFVIGMHDLMDRFGVPYQALEPEAASKSLGDKLNKCGGWLIVGTNAGALARYQLETHIPPKGGTVLMTAEDSYTISGMGKVLRLHSLLKEEVLTHFHAIVGTNSAEVSDASFYAVGEALSCSPLYISLLACYLRDIPAADDSSQFDRVISRVKNSDTPVQEVYALIFDRLQGLPEVWNVLSRLSLLNGDLCDEVLFCELVAARDVAKDGEETDVRASLERLRLLSLLGDSNDTHRITKDAVRQRLRDDGKLTAVVEDVANNIFNLWQFENGEPDIDIDMKRCLIFQLSTLNKERSAIRDDETRTRMLRMLANGAAFALDKLEEPNVSESIMSTIDERRLDEETAMLRIELYWAFGRLHCFKGESKAAMAAYTAQEEAVHELKDIRWLSKHAGGVGLCLSSMGLYAKSLEKQEFAYEIDKKLYGAHHENLAAILHNIGTCCFNLERCRIALNYFERALRILKKSKSKRGYPFLASCLSSIALCKSTMGDMQDAIDYQRESLDVRLEAVGRYHPSVASTYTSLGGYYSDDQDYRASMEMFGRAKSILIRIHGEEHKSVASAWSTIGSCYSRLGELNDALKAYKKCLAINLGLYGDNHEAVAATYARIGFCYNSQRNHELSLEMHEKALNIYKKIYGEDHPIVADCYGNIGICYSNLARFSSSLDMYKRSFSLYKKLYDGNHPTIASNRLNPGLPFRGLTICENSLQIYEKSLAINKNMLMDTEPERENVVYAVSDFNFSFDGLIHGLWTFLKSFFRGVSVHV